MSVPRRVDDRPRGRLARRRERRAARKRGYDDLTEFRRAQLEARHEARRRILQSRRQAAW